MAPMARTVVSTWMISFAPMSRNRSSWLMSSFNTAIRSPVARFSKPRVVELLDVGVGVDPKVVLDVLGEVPPGAPVQELEQRLRRPDGKGEHTDADQLRSRRGQTHPLHDRRTVVDDHVDRQTDQQRRREIEQLVQHRVEARQPDPAVLTARMAPEPHEWLG